MALDARLTAAFQRVGQEIKAVKASIPAGSGGGGALPFERIQNVKGWTFDPVACTQAPQLVSAHCYLGRVVVPEAATVTGLRLRIMTAGGVTWTRLALSRVDTGAALATGNHGSGVSGPLWSAAGPVDIPFSAPVLVDPGEYFAAISTLQGGSAPTVMGCTAPQAASMNTGLAAAELRWATPAPGGANFGNVPNPLVVANLMARTDSPIWIGLY